jgi:uncharacterized heparinase superfamily protein
MGRLLGRGSVAERLKLSALVVARATRSTVSHINTNPLSRWRFASSRTDRLLIAPQDLRTADATRATEIYAGRFAFAGKVVICDRRSPFEMAAPSTEWAATLFGFSWLRHLRAGGSAITRANARALIDDWIAVQSVGKGIAWRSDVLSRRIISWLSHAPLVLTETDARFYRRFLRSLTRQVRYLRALFKETRDGAPRLQAAIALAYAALCLQGEFKQLRSAVRRLTDELDRQVLPDGGHISRNPGTLVDLLLDLLPLRQAFNARQLPVPQSLNNAVDRMMPMLRFFRHGDGNFALFNGMGPTAADLNATVLAYDDARGTPVSNAPHSGYQRMELGDTVVLIDTGKPPPMALSQEAHAGTLSFELSWRSHRIVVNCGLPAVGRETWRQVARATAAHSTVTLNDTSSASFGDARLFKNLLFGAPIVSGPRMVHARREDSDDGILLQTQHDGYVDAFGIVHARTLALSADGTMLAGEEHFMPPDGATLAGHKPDEFAVRFHLHPTVRANRLRDGRGVILVMPDREAWTFTVEDGSVEIEESVFLAGSDRPRRTVQIVVYGHARDSQTVRWSFLHMPKTVSGQVPNPDEPELPLRIPD